MGPGNEVPSGRRAPGPPAALRDFHHSASAFLVVSWNGCFVKLGGLAGQLACSFGFCFLFFVFGLSGCFIEIRISFREECFV